MQHPDFHWPIARLIAFVLFACAAIYVLLADPGKFEVWAALLSSGLAVWMLE